MNNLNGNRKNEFRRKQEEKQRKLALKIKDEAGELREGSLKSEEAIPSLDELCAMGERVEQQTTFSAKEAIRNKIKARRDDDLNPVLIKLGYTNSLGVYVEENFAYLLAPDCSYADLEELSNLANEAIGAQMKYPNDVNNMYRNTYNAYPLSKVWNFYTRSWS
jgi:hypothetical protein